MKNPWEEIKLADYEAHMALDSVMQLQVMNQVMKEQFYRYPVKTILLLGIAGGNGMEHVDPERIETIYGVDVNREYLRECEKRYPELGTLKLVCADLRDETAELPKADLVVANLLIEYIGYQCFQKLIRRQAPRYVTCGIQIDPDEGFVSDSPYLHVFDGLDSVHSQIDGKSLEQCMAEIGYGKILEKEYPLPNGKKLLSLDFAE